MRDADTEVAQNRRVGEIALPARDRQLCGQMPQDGVRDPEVAFGVLEVDRVDLVRHGRGADLARDGALLEIAERDVAPEVAREVDQDGVEAREGVEQLRHVIMGLDLGGVGVPGQPERLDEGRVKSGQSMSG
jgi:hypothetical protein